MANARTRIGYDLVLGRQAGLQAHCGRYQTRYVRSEQMIRPNPIAYAVGGGVVLAIKGVGAVVPDESILFNDPGEF